MDSIVEYLISTFASEKGYAALFKGGVFLIGAAMIALAHTGSFLYNKDIQAHQAKYQFEAVSRQRLNKNTDCSKFKSGVRAKCNIAKHEMYTLQPSLNLFYTVFWYMFWLGFALLASSALGFIITPLVRNGDTKHY